MSIVFNIFQHQASPLFSSDPYEQVVLPVDGLKEEEPVEPYQKIGPSKTSAHLAPPFVVFADLKRGKNK